MTAEDVARIFMDVPGDGNISDDPNFSGSEGDLLSESGDDDSESDYTPAADISDMSDGGGDDPPSGHQFF